MEDYEMKVSDFVKKLMYKVMKHSTKLEQGFICFKNRTIIKAHFDPDACDQYLKDVIVNKDNVLRYLKRKYVPTKIETGVIYKDQNCIQRAVVKEDGSLIISIKKSEPHKIITDTFHVIEDLRVCGFKHNLNIKYSIERVQIAYQDTLLYNELLKEFGLPVPAPARIYAKQLLFKYGKLEKVAKIKKRSVKRKFLRYYAKLGKITWQELRDVINITDFSAKNIKTVCMNIRNAAKERGVKINF